MTERPILFSGAMVRAIREKRKTQTRRVIKPVRGFEHHSILKYGMPYAADPWAVWWHSDETERVGCLQECPHGKPGDRLWVRETWLTCREWDSLPPSEISDMWVRDTKTFPIWRLADGPNNPTVSGVDGKTRPGIFMPRRLSRITLEIAAVRAERLQDISEEDAKTEGATPIIRAGTLVDEEMYRRGFRALWGSINGNRPKCAWFDNPWVWCVTFREI